MNLILGLSQTKRKTNDHKWKEGHAVRESYSGLYLYCSPDSSRKC